MRKTKTRLTDLPRTSAKADRFAALDASELRRTVGGLPKTVTTGQCTTNNDDYCDCD